VTYGHEVAVGDLTSEVVNLTAVSNQVWTTRIYEDENGNGIKDAADDLISETPPLGPYEKYAFLVQVDVALGTSGGTVDVTTVTAQGQSSALSDSAADTARVGVPPIVDGLLDDGYTWLGYFTKGDPDGHSTLAPGDLYSYEGDDVCYWVFAVDRAFNDNVYADAGLDDAYMLEDGWTVEHSFSKLEGSDKAIFDVTYSGGSHLGLEIDYINSNNQNDPGDAPISEVGTSLVWNMANSNWDGGAWGDPEKHSPPYDYNQTSGEYWEWQMIYEFGDGSLRCDTDEIFVGWILTKGRL